MSKMDFLPMPVDAMLDPRLSLAHIRILAVIAFHDRRGANGRGCFATVSTMAKEARYDTRTVKRVLADLRDFNFISSEKGLTDARRLVHRVVYQSALLEKGDIDATNSGENRGHPVQRKGASAEGVLLQNHEVTPPKQRPKQTQGEADAVETAPFLRNDADILEFYAHHLTDERSTSRYLRLVQESMERMQFGERQEHAVVMLHLESTLEFNSTLYQWSRRLMAELEFLNDCDAYDEANA